MNYNLKTKSGMKNSTAWLSSHLSRIKDGGMWMIPRSGTVYEVRHADKVAIKIMSTMPDPSLDIVFRAAGWKVTDNT